MVYDKGRSDLAANHTDKVFSSMSIWQLAQGDLVLVAARPGHGKTLKCMELLVEAVNNGREGVFFTLAYSEEESRKLLRRVVESSTTTLDKLYFDVSDQINADYIIRTMQRREAGSVAVVDYLQLLDKKRSNPELSEQVLALKTFAKESRQIIVFISQVDRRYEHSGRSLPGPDDIRLPNPLDPLDLSLFDKGYFLNRGMMVRSRLSN